MVFILGGRKPLSVLFTSSMAEPSGWLPSPLTATWACVTDAIETEKINTVRIVDFIKYLFKCFYFSILFFPKDIYFIDQRQACLSVPGARPLPPLLV
jgi:hypothetical protein